MLDLNDVSRQVLENCDITDARYAGIYSVCGLAMRLRDLYKWEQKIPFWQEGDADAVLDWIGEKEDAWETLTAKAFEPLTLNGHCFDPFDTQQINAALNPQGFYYGAGYAHSLKPTFFLAEINQKTTVAGHTVWYLGREVARDLLTLPAFSQDRQIVLRGDAGRMFLWDQIMYINKAGRRPLALTLQACGLPNAEPESIRQHMETILDVQQTVCLWHEVGELEEQVFERQLWRQILSDYPHSVIEMFARTLKDVLADTGDNGALSVIIAHRNPAALGLYMAFVKGLFPLLCGELVCAFDRFLNDPQWEILASAKDAIRQKTTALTRRTIDIYNRGQRACDPDGTRQAIESLMKQNGLITD
jgi:hypothetical protein